MKRKSMVGLVGGMLAAVCILAGCDNDSKPTDHDDDKAPSSSTTTKTTEPYVPAVPMPLPGIPGVYIFI